MIKFEDGSIWKYLSREPFPSASSAARQFAVVGCFSNSNTCSDFSTTLYLDKIASFVFDSAKNG
jgi:hypothetical protein